ncbi:MAG: hypothetical protein IPL43_04520 [Micropruina sp.]|nr:hypothetical protein [Micropruina sp.]
MDKPALRRWLTGLLVGGLALTACTGPAPTPSTSTSQTPAPARPFTVVTSQKVSTTDPAGITTDAGTIVALNVYQRLMLVHPATGALKPDAATDCLFNSPTVYECTLPKDLTFSNGHALTSSDVKFSLLRALRLDGTATSAGLLGSLSRIDTPAPDVVRFKLQWADSQFGYALAAPAASIVDEEAYDSDSLAPVEQVPAGSGPYRLDLLDVDGLTFSLREDYIGPNRGSIKVIRLAYVADSPAAEEAIATNQAEVVWRTLDEPALARLRAEIDAGETGTTTHGFKPWGCPASACTAWSGTQTRPCAGTPR